jgi:putative transposase
VSIWLDFYSVNLYIEDMKLVVQIQLMPDADQSARLRATVERTNRAANWIAGIAFEHQEANVFELRKLAYHEVRAKFGLSSQQAQLAIKAVSDAYKRDKSIGVSFREHAAIAYDQRTMGFKGIDRVSLLTLEGRIVVPFILGKYQADRIGNAKGQCDLVSREDGKWFLIVTVDVPEGSPIPVTDFIGVDLGIAQIATDSDGNSYSGKPVEWVRRKHNLQRKRLQKKNTRGAKKKLKRVAGKEARFRKHENHCISKQIVATAKGTGRGIACEDLTDIRDRPPAYVQPEIRYPKPWIREARNQLSGWSFAQLVAFLTYKAALAGVPLVKVDAHYTSQTCSRCGLCSRDNRKSQAKFLCVSCGHAANADKNAAENLSALGISKLPIGLAGPRA